MRALRAGILCQFLALSLGSLLFLLFGTQKWFLQSCSRTPLVLSSCGLKNRFRGVILVIVFNHPLYSNIPLLQHLYGKAFPTIMFCGPKPEEDFNDFPVEYLYIRKGYFAYECLARAMEKYEDDDDSVPETDVPTTQDIDGYLLINDDVLLNYWNIVNFDRSKIWEGPRTPITLKGIGVKDYWYWWNSTWGMATCQKAFNEIGSSVVEVTTQVPVSESESPGVLAESPQTSRDVAESLETLARNGNGTPYCYRGRSDVFYIPQKHARRFQDFAHAFYKHGVFLEITVPTISRMLDLEENFQYISGIYLPGRVNDTTVTDSKYFWQVYNRSLHFVHPFKLNHADGELNKALLNTWILDYTDKLASC